MNLIFKIREDLKLSIKNNEEIKKNILRIVISLLQKDFDVDHISDDKVINVIKKTIKNNEDDTLIKALKNKGDIKSIEKLNLENNILKSYLPRSLTLDELKQFIEDNDLIENIINESNNGKCIGLIMGLIKKNNILVETNVVKELIQLLKSN